MDEMRIESKPIRKLVSKLIKLVILKKLGYDVDVELNCFRATTMVDEKTHVHLDVDFDLNKEEFDKLMKRIGL